MKIWNLQTKITLVLGALSLAGLAFSHLALTDIYHGESDVSLEWQVVRISFVVFFLFVGMAFFALLKKRRE